MATILLSLYGKKHGKSPAAVIRMAERGSFDTAKKEGRQWFIDENEPYPDLRVKHGKYIGIRARSGNRSNRKKNEDNMPTQPS